MREPIDLADERMRGYVLAASDESISARSCLIRSQAPVAGGPPDGWVTRRRRDIGYDWAVVRLGVPGVVEEVVVDTTHLEHDTPSEISVEGCVAPHNTDSAQLSQWVELVPRSDLGSDRVNRFAVESQLRFTHLRLNVFPDGGIARFRVFGQPVPTWMAPGLRPFAALDLAALANGGHVHSTSSGSGQPQNLLSPGCPKDGQDSWLTARRREEGNEWAVIRLVGPGTLQAVTVDTTHLHGDSPAGIRLEGASAQDPADDQWFDLLTETPTLPHTVHEFQDELAPHPDLLWVRLNLLPDGGISRLRLWGRLSEAGYEEARLLYLNTAPPAALQKLFKQVCHSDRWAAEMSASAPFQSLTDLLKKGAGAWAKCNEKDWRQALDGHPRIGEKASGEGLSAQWSRGEQSKAQTVDSEIADKLRQAQAHYYQKFGFIFLICASGRSSQEILAAVEKRLHNSAAEEMQIVAEEQAKIIHLRLEKLLK